MVWNKMKESDQRKELTKLSKERVGEMIKAPQWYWGKFSNEENKCLLNFLKKGSYLSLAQCGFFCLNHVGCPYPKECFFATPFQAAFYGILLFREGLWCIMIQWSCDNGEEFRLLCWVVLLVQCKCDYRSSCYGDETHKICLGYLWLTLCLLLVACSVALPFM